MADSILTQLGTKIGSEFKAHRLRIEALEGLQNVTLGLVGNVLTLTDQEGTDTDIDLSLYLDDTNLARLVSGTYDSGSQSLIFTRDDNSTFSVDASMFFDDTNLVTSVAGKTGVVTLAKADVGLGNVDNTSDANKPVSTATQTALDGKVDKVVGKGLSTNDYTTAEKTKLAGIEAGATADQTKADIDALGINAATVGGFTVGKSVPSNAVFTDTTYSVATTSANGLMSSTDKTKLDGVATNANNYSHPTGDGNLHVPATGTTNNGKVLTAGSTAGSLSWTTIPSAPVTSVAGKTGVVTLAKADVGLGNVDNTADSAKNVLSATKLTTARTINGVSFDGTANITVADSTKLPLAGGTISGDLTVTGTITETSDARVKENVQTLENSLEMVKSLRGVSYNKIGSDLEEIGFIAQEVEEILPELVMTDSEGNKSVVYSRTVALLVEAMKQQQKQIDELKQLLK
jgi:hypothetical protein